MGAEELQLKLMTCGKQKDALLFLWQQVIAEERLLRQAEADLTELS